ncbi:hypothetical protein FQN57_004796 [Myotisia sp. PD_48]|nr:hypothetical protein FQN57_004796 [Myotisia sp. PD_48]
MSETYERERQNNSLLESLSQKTNALKSVTIDIYDNARNQESIDNTSEVFDTMTTSLKGSASRLTRMARQGDRISVLKLAGIVVGTGVGGYMILSWIF